MGGCPLDPHPLVNDIHKYHLYIPISDDIVRDRHSSHKTNVTYLTFSLTLYH